MRGGVVKFKLDDILNYFFFIHFANKYYYAAILYKAWVY